MTKQLKNILLAGVPRSGKTILARKISQTLSLSHLPLDPIVTSFEAHFPQHGIVHHNLKLEAICSNFLPFLTTLLTEMNQEGTYFCADSYHVLPDGALKLKDSLEVRTIFLGYPSISADQKLKQIIECAEEGDWTRGLPVEHLRSLVERFIEESRIMQNECGRLGIPFIDTGEDFTAVLDSTFQLLNKSWPN